MSRVEACRCQWPIRSPAVAEPLAVLSTGVPLVLRRHWWSRTRRWRTYSRPPRRSHRKDRDDGDDQSRLHHRDVCCHLAVPQSLAATPRAQSTDGYALKGEVVSAAPARKFGRGLVSCARQARLRRNRGAAAGDREGVMNSASSRPPRWSARPWSCPLPVREASARPPVPPRHRFHHHRANRVVELVGDHVCVAGAAGHHERVGGGIDVTISAPAHRGPARRAPMPFSVTLLNTTTASIAQLGIVVSLGHCSCNPSGVAMMPAGTMQLQAPTPTVGHGAIRRRRDRNGFPGPTAACTADAHSGPDHHLPTSAAAQPKPEFHR